MAADSPHELVVNRALLPLYALRDFRGTARNAKEAQDQKLAAVLEEMSLSSGETPADKSAAKLVSALAKRDEESELSRSKKPARMSHFERFLTGGHYPNQEMAALHLFQYLSTKDLVHSMTASSRLVRFATQLPFTMSLRVAEVIRLGKTSTATAAGAAASGVGARTKLLPRKAKAVNLGLLRGCHLNIGGATSSSSSSSSSSSTEFDQGGDVVGAEGVEPLSAFFTNTSREMCVVDSLAVQFGATVNDPSIQAFIKLLSRPILSRLLALSLEGCTMGVAGLQVLGETMRKKCLPVLSTLNVSRTYAQYLGIHKLGSAIATGCCPFLSTLRISSNYARSAVFDLFDAAFASKSTFLMTLEAQDNDCDLMDPEIIAILNRGLTTWRNWISLDLSFNPLGDTTLCNKLLKQVWPLDPKEYSENYHAGLKMESLCLQGCSVGVNSVSYLAQVWMHRDKHPIALTSLNLGMNEIDLTAFKRLLEPLMANKLPSLKELSLPLNLLQPEGIILISNACTLGVLDSLTLLDIADVGGNSESILVLARALVLRGNSLRLQRLKILGLAPFAGRTVRTMFSPDFLKSVAVS